MDRQLSSPNYTADRQIAMAVVIQFSGVVGVVKRGEREAGVPNYCLWNSCGYVGDVMAKFRKGDDILMGREIHARVSSSRVALSSLHSDISPMELQRSSSGHAMRCRSATLEMIVRKL